MIENACSFIISGKGTTAKSANKGGGGGGYGATWTTDEIGQGGGGGGYAETGEAKNCHWSFRG